MRVVLAGGGTAGHINPALAIAQAIKAKQPDSEILFVGNCNSLEETLVKRAGFDIKFIKIQGFHRKKLYKNFTTLRLLMSSIKEAKRILREFAPDVVVGTGGYVSGPVLLAACSLKLHTCIHEQNAYPGMTSQMLARRVEKVFISFESSSKYFSHKDKLVLTGNPLRCEFKALDRAQSRKELGLRDEDFYVLSFGGSLGAQAINRAMISVMETDKQSKEFVHCHGMGRLGSSWMPAQLEQKGITTGEVGGRFRVLDYIHDMPRQMAAADAVIARAGAITIGELLAQGKPSILIPSPNVTHNHQYYNAKALADRGAAIMIEEKDLSPEGLYETLLALKQDESHRSALSEAALKMALATAADDIADHIVTKLC
ncbi:MAG: undecaprenyldiphospho-muramoylpentapeptide beta-N-acetylglucosaminyltransferase [Clostridia bacterium]|nr:undecaprenyldiphospho-muramoylpentapeptide beta-N-acetylglucosaminyltransferase [Clostridia bacterium]